MFLQLDPLSGPLEGGTALTVDGENLGLSVNDTSVSVSGLECVVVEYHSAVRYQNAVSLFDICLISVGETRTSFVNQQLLTIITLISLLN